MNKALQITRYFLPRIIICYFINLLVILLFSFFSSSEKVSFSQALVDAVKGFPIWLALTYFFLRALGKKEVE